MKRNAITFTLNAVCVLYLFTQPFYVEAGTKKKPNIVFILADDLGYGDVTIAPNVNRTNFIPTPNIEKLARSGTKFLRGYSGQVCAPSRCTLMTGRHTGHCTIRGNDGAYTPLLSNDTTVAALLKKANYTTGLAGKWGLGNFGSTGYPLQQGFDFFVGQDSQVSCHNWYPSIIQNQTNGVSNVIGNEEVGPQCIEKGNTKCKWMNDITLHESLKFIRQNANKDNPFFLYLSTTTPHTGFLRGSKSDWPTPFQYKVFQNETWSDEQKQFASAVWAQDKIVGAVIEELEELKIRNDTIVFFSGDNGPDSHDFHVFDDPGPFRGKKRSLHEGGIRQIIVASWPGTVRAGGSSDQLFAFWDFFATAAQLADIPSHEIPAHDGISILPTLIGNNSAQINHTHLYWEFCDPNVVNGLLEQQYEPGWIQAVRYDDEVHQWKGIRSNSDSSSLLLFDLSNDISESIDRALYHPDIVKKILELMENSHTEIATWKSSKNKTDKCCASCFNPKGCPSPCVTYPSAPQIP